MILFVAFAHVLLLLFLWHVERTRTAKTGPDLLQLFFLVFAIYLIIPGALLLAMVGLFSSNHSTEIFFFDKVLNHVGAIESGLVLLLAMLFVASLYITWAGLHTLFGLNRRYVPKISILVSPQRWIFIMLLGLTGMWLLLELLGGGLIGYQNLMLFRAGFEGIERTFATANLFSQVQTFLFLSILGVAIFWKSRSRTGLSFAVFCVMAFGLMSVSRRAFALAMLLLYFASVLANGKFYLFRFVVPTALFFLPIIMFGKEFIAYFSIHGDVPTDIGDFGAASGLAGVRRALSDIGISIVESWATVMYLDISPRLGVDHIVSLAKRMFPQFLGFNIDWPKRIVEISTEKFLGYPDQDIPPGFIGQMWLDFRLLGPVIWGVIFGIQLSLLQMAYNRISKSFDAIVLFAIVLYVVAMPINTGSFDFTFSVDIILLLILMRLVTVQRRVGF